MSLISFVFVCCALAWSTLMLSFTVYCGWHLSVYLVTEVLRRHLARWKAQRTARRWLAAFKREVCK